MKQATKRLAVELPATAVASPLLLILLACLHAWSVLAVLAIPTLPVERVLADWLNLVSPPQDGWLSGLANPILAGMILLPLWTWILLMIAVKLFERFRPKREIA